MRREAYSPAHVTGFFSIYEANDPFRTGSIGAGICISKGVYTSVDIRPSSRNRIFIYINDELDPAPTSATVVRYYLKSIREKYLVKVWHHIDVPIGAGFGTSGGGALSLSYALNDLLGEIYSRMEAGQIAHYAEVVNRTGLGTVIAEFHGGLEVRVEPGAPGIGRVIKYPVPKDKVFVAINFGKIFTKTILSNKVIKKRIMDRGSKFVLLFQREPSIENLLILSRRFAYETGLMNDIVADASEFLIRHGYEPAMAMLGKTVFTIVDVGEINEVVKLLRSEYGDTPRLIVSRIEERGARILS